MFYHVSLVRHELSELWRNKVSRAISDFTHVERRNKSRTKSNDTTTVMESVHYIVATRAFYTVYLHEANLIRHLYS